MNDLSKAPQGDPQRDSAEERVLTVLKTRGAMTAHRLAAQLGITPVAVRKQLTRLEQKSLVGFQEEVRGPGRPERLWRLTAQGHGRFPDTHAQLTLDLIDSVRHIFGEEGLERLIAAREHSALATYRKATSNARTLKERAEILARQRTREGYMAAVEEQKDGTLLLVENHCPICAAATRCQGFCRSELNMFRAVLGEDAKVSRTDHILAGARRCAYRIETEKGRF